MGKRQTFFLATIWLLATIAILCACEPQKPAPKPRPEFRAGTEVILKNGSPNTDLGLWLFYEDSCSIDIVYYSVPHGTTATLTGKVCIYAGEIYYKVRFPPEIMAKYQILSDNTWIEESYLQVAK